MRPPQSAIVDARDEVCPVPLTLAEARLPGLLPGDELIVLCTDPAAPIDFEAWCLANGHNYLGVTEKPTWSEIKLRVASQGPMQSGC